MSAHFESWRWLWFAAVLAAGALLIAASASARAPGSTFRDCAEMVVLPVGGFLTGFGVIGQN